MKDTLNAGGLWDKGLRLIYGDQKTWARLWNLKRNAARTKGSAGPARKAETPIKEEDERPTIIKQESTRNSSFTPLRHWALCLEASGDVWSLP